MSLFDYIGEKLNQTQKFQLYQDRIVCLCIFRVALNELEQQIILKLVILQKPFQQKDITDMLNFQPQEDGEIIDQTQQHEEFAQNFLLKLRKLDLIVENIIEQSKTPSVNQIMGSIGSLPQIGRQQSVLPLQRESSLTHDQVRNRTFRLMQDFSRNMEFILEQNLDLTLIKLKKAKDKYKPPLQEVEKEASDKWEKVIFFMLNISQGDIKQNIVELLEKAKYLELNQNSYQLTASGFKFILYDPPTQVHQIILNYIKQAEQMGRNHVELLQFIFNLTITESNEYYRVKVDNGNIDVMIQDFIDMGLITQFFYKGKINLIGVTSLLQAFLLSQNSILYKNMPKPESIDIQSAKPKTDHKFIIVETNFRVFAYTNSKLYKALLRLFIRVDYIFPNLLVGCISRKNVQQAFNRGITATQITQFLEAHTHIKARLDKFLMIQEKSKANQDYSQNSYQRVKEGKKKFEEEKQQSIAEIFGLSSVKQNWVSKDQEFLPPNVKQQLFLWENELSCVEALPGLLIEFETIEKLKTFKNFADRQKIKIHSTNEQAKLIVVDQAFEKEAYEFIQSDN